MLARAMGAGPENPICCLLYTSFERWVFDEVLPTIRQHGAYLTREKLWEVATSPEALLKLCSDLLAEREKNAALQAENARLQGKAVYYDLFIDCLLYTSRCV